ncbi:MAG: DHHA1 domain-containing protein [Halothiobacillaceae bacterium]
MATPPLNPPEGWLYHLSHTDLDGYGAQYMVRQAGIRAKFFNADYRDIPQVLARIFDEIDAAREPASVLITDLNLTIDQANWMLRRRRKLKLPVHLQLLDHHATGAECAEKFDWYHLDTDRCATRLTFEAVSALMAESQRERMRQRADFVDVGDRWLKDSPDFRRSIYLIGLIMQDDHLAPPLSDLKRIYRFHLIEGFFKALEDGASLEDIERSLYDLRKQFLKGRVEKRVFADRELPLADKFHKLSAEVLDPTSIPMLEIDGYRAGLFLNWPHDVWRGVIMELMENQQRMDMAIGVRGNGKLSLRANPGVDVGTIASRYFGGGGHPGAAGGELRESRLRDVQHALKAITQQIESVNNPA